MSGSTKARKPHVCVVGTGIAGLRCASVLLENGVRVTMLEARDRIGGRVCYPDHKLCSFAILFLSQSTRTDRSRFAKVMVLDILSICNQELATSSLACPGLSFTAAARNGSILRDTTPSYASPKKPRRFYTLGTGRVKSMMRTAKRSRAPRPTSFRTWYGKS